MWLAPVPGATAEDVLATASVALDAAFPSLRAGPELCAEAFAAIVRAGRVQVRDLLLSFPIGQRRGLEMGLAWMAKYGFVDWLT
jgi:hypothetical protein